MNARLEALGWWAIDFHLAAAVLLGTACAALVCLRQPVHRIALAWATSIGLLLLASLTSLPGWPRTNWWQAVGTNSGRSADSLALVHSRSDPLAAPAVMRDAAADVEMQVKSPVEQPQPDSDQNGARGRTSEAPARRAELAETPFGKRVNGPRALGVVFALSAILSGAWLLLGTAQVARLRRRARPAPPELARLLEHLMDGACSAPFLLVSGDVNQPLATGLARPVIVLPERLAATEPPPHLTAALAHEWAHIRHRDLWLLALARLLLPLLALQPLFWWWRRMARQSQEELADAAAASHSDRVEYAEVLMSWARGEPERVPRGMAGSLALWERPSQLKRRVARLLRGGLVDLRCSRRVRLSAICTTLAAVIGVSLPSLRPVADAEPHSAAVSQSEGLIHAMKQVDPPPDAETFVCDLTLDPGGTITVNVVDSGGRPLSGFEADGKSATWHGFGAVVHGDSFDVVELGPDETRTVVIRHKQRKLAKAVNVRLADHPGGAVSVTLAPSAKIVGRVVDQNGAAVPAATVTLYWYGVERGSNGVLPALTTDDRGRFEYTDIPSGCIYNVQTNISGNNRIYLNDIQKLAPGETKDLGEIRVDRAAKAAAEQVPAVRLVDSDGQPVAGAWVGVGAYCDSDDDPVWAPYSPKGVSDDGGHAEIVGRSLPDERVVLYARHEAKNLAALGAFSREELLNAPEMVLQAACRVHGVLTSDTLVAGGRKLDWTNVYLYRASDRPLSFSSKQQQFEFYLPPGKYRLNAYGTDTLAVDREIDVPARSELNFGIIDLPATKLATLMGKPAPELRRIQGWKNGPGVTLADLRGKYVLLDFWGYWCGPCIRDMPHLMKLHDMFADRGLAVIAIHDASVESIDEMDRKLNDQRQWGSIREQEWWGRDLPFPVALDGVPAAAADRGHGATIDAYGINFFPTALLIDREGKVVKQMAAWDANLPDTLAELLGVAGEPPTWRKRFDEVYQLAPGEVLRHVPPPFIAERTNFITEQNAGGGARQWTDKLTLTWDGATSPGRANCNDDSLSSVLTSLAGVYRGDTFDCPPELGKRRVAGDWIVAHDAPLDKRLQALEVLLRDKLGLKVRIERKQIEREVIVVSGQYRFVPLRSEDKYIHVSTNGRDLDDVCGGGTGVFPEWLDWMSHLMGIRFVGETEPPAGLKLQWYQHPSTIPGKSLSTKELDQFFANLARQTSLTFDRQHRELDLWSVREEP